MDPKTFMRSLEEQLRRVKFQYNHLLESKSKSEVSIMELLDNARLWFLRTVQNTDLRYNDMIIPAAEFITDYSFERQKNPPYNMMFPSVLWIISTMPSEQIHSIFGITYLNRLKTHFGISAEYFDQNHKITDDKS